MPKVRGILKKRQHKAKPDYRRSKTPPKQKSENKCELEYKLPSDLKMLLERSLKTSDKVNSGLYLNRYVGFDSNGKSEISEQCALKMLKSPDMYPFFLKKQESLFQSMKDAGYHGDSFGYTLKSRMIVGLGGESVYETSITLHRNLGVPYIPGSALKGIANHYGMDTEYRNMDKLFGTQSEQETKEKGKAVFFDAFPVTDAGNNIFEIDIMNPHYSDYYSEGKPPGDWMKPIPIKFLTVKKGTEYRFYITSTDENLLNDAINLLKGALKENGVGAKTSLGYGRFVF